MKQLALRIGSVLYPLLTAFALTGAAACTDSAAPDDEMEEPGTPDSPDSPDSPDVPAAPHAGDVDKRFGTNGVLTLGQGFAGDIEAQGDKLVVCTTDVDGDQHQARLYRYAADGTLDTTFGIEGRVTLPQSNSWCRDLAMGTEGMAVIVHGAKDWTVLLDKDGGDAASYTGSELNRVTARANAFIAANVYHLTQADIGLTKVFGISDAVETQTAANDVTRVVRAFRYEGLEQLVYTTADNRINLGVSHGTVFGVDLTASVNVGSSTPDIASDASILPDGSMFAIGTADGTDAMAIRWVSNDGYYSFETFTEHHKINGISASLGLTVAQGQAIVVGRSELGGHQAFAWQRYAMNSVALDASYQKQGMAMMAAPSGDAELVSVVELNGALYALGTFDTETNSPKIALLEIVE